MISSSIDTGKVVIEGNSTQIEHEFAMMAMSLVGKKIISKEKFEHIAELVLKSLSPEELQKMDQLSMEDLLGLASIVAMSKGDVEMLEVLAKYGDIFKRGNKKND